MDKLVVRYVRTEHNCSMQEHIVMFTYVLALFYKLVVRYVSSFFICEGTIVMFSYIM
jgi:hypothetical protein